MVTNSLLDFNLVYQVRRKSRLTRSGFVENELEPRSPRGKRKLHKVLLNILKTGLSFLKTCLQSKKNSLERSSLLKNFQKNVKKSYKTNLMLFLKIGVEPAK